MTSAIEMDKDPGFVMTISNGMVDADCSNDSVEAVYNSKHFSADAVKRFKRMLASDYETGKVSTVSKYREALLGDAPGGVDVEAASAPSK